jgi:hypothetical protein
LTDDYLESCDIPSFYSQNFGSKNAEMIYDTDNRYYDIYEIEYGDANPDGESFIVFTTIIGAIAGYITAWENGSDLLLGVITGAILGLAVGLVATHNITSFTSGLYSLGKKLLTDTTAYLSFGASFAFWEDYCISSIFGGMSGFLPTGLKWVNEVISVPFSYQITKMGTRGFEFDLNKFAYSAGVRAITYNLNPMQKSVIKRFAKGFYYWWYSNNLDEIFS